MVSLLHQACTLDQFLALPEEEAIQFELVNGLLVAMGEPTDLHEAIVRFLDIEFSIEMRAQRLKYTTRRRNVLRLPPINGRRPDLAVIDKPDRWRESEIEQGIDSVPHLIVEVASPSNWSNDLVAKQELYQELGVAEYWVVDYQGCIPGKYCQRGKGRKVFVFTLESGEYQQAEYLATEVVRSRVFSELQLTVEQILAAED